MHIIEITVFAYQANYSHGTYAMSGGRVSTGQPSIVVRIRTDTGLEGWGETSPLGTTYLPSSFNGEIAALKDLSDHVLGLDPRHPAVLTAAMDRAMLSGTAAKAVLDYACWDVFGKAVGLPTHALLGGCLTQNIPCFTVIPPGDPDAGVRKALTDIARGVAAIQVKIGFNPVHDAKRIKAIHKAIPSNIEIWADANGGWTIEQALTFARALGQDTSVALEQPCKSSSECAEVGRRTGLPINLDESVMTIGDLFSAHAAGVTGINLKPSRVGGLLKARIMRDTAVALDMMVTVDDTWGCALSMMQMIQLAPTTPSDRLRALDLFTDWIHPAISEAPQQRSGGFVSPPAAPGNGYGTIKLESLGDPLFQRTLEDGEIAESPS